MEGDLQKGYPPGINHGWKILHLLRGFSQGTKPPFIGDFQVARLNTEV
jgi:hypothetical protein